MANEMIKVLFLGTAEFAIPSLQKLLEDERVEVVGIVTQPDRPAERKQNLRATPVKQFIVSNYPELRDLIFTPEKLKLETQEILTQTKPDMIITAAYGQIVPQDMLDYPALKAWNIHGSILPHLRGAVPVHMAILQGMQTTGVTIQRMVAQMDAGAVLADAMIEIEVNETTASLMPKLANLGANLLAENLAVMISDEYELVEQDESQATYCYQKDIAKPQAQITFDTSVTVAERMVRAFDPWPIAWFEVPSGDHAGKRVKVFGSKVYSTQSSEAMQLLLQEEKLILQLHDGQIELTELQLEGKDRREAAGYSFLV